MYHFSFLSFFHFKIHSKLQRTFLSGSHVAAFRLSRALTGVHFSILHFRFPAFPLFPLNSPLFSRFSGLISGTRDVSTLRTSLTRGLYVPLSVSSLGPLSVHTSTLLSHVALHVATSTTFKHSNCSFTSELSHLTVSQSDKQ